MFSCEHSCPQNISPIALILLGRCEGVQVKFFRNPGYMATDLHTGNAEYWLSQAYITCTPYKVYSIIFGSGELGRNLFCKYTVHVAVHICMYVPLTFYVIREQKLCVACVFPALNAALLFLSAFTTTHSHH